MVINKIYQLESFGITDIGLVREKNEDAWGAFPEQGLFLLADGMGGHSAGEIASKEAIEYLCMLFRSWLGPQSIDPSDAAAFFEEALAKVNSRIYEEGESDEELKGMGTTLCLLYLHSNVAVVGHVGDSRIYRIRPSGFEQLTEDHSLVNEMLAIGAMRPEESEVFPYKHILTRAIGTHPHVDPTLNIIDVKPGDLFLLCSDGLTNYVSDDNIAQILRQGGSLAEKGQALIDRANEQGGADNISAVLVQVGNNEPFRSYP